MPLDNSLNIRDKKVFPLVLDCNPILPDIQRVIQRHVHLLSSLYFYVLSTVLRISSFTLYIYIYIYIYIDECKVMDMKQTSNCSGSFFTAKT